MGSRKPNILFIITDHHAWYDHRRPGEFTFDLPVWDRFCAEGVRFDRAYSVCPLCTPARASMMSGLYPSHHGLLRNTDAGNTCGNTIEFREGQRLFNHALADAGYRCGYVGKWHCGHERLPVDYGMEGWSLPDYGAHYSAEAYQAYASKLGLGEPRARVEHHLDHPEWAGQTVSLSEGAPWRAMDGFGVMEGPPEAHEQQFVAHLSSQKLKELAAGDKPWSLVASFWGPHQPFYPSEPYASMIDPESIPEYPSFSDDLSGRPMRYRVHRDLIHNAPRSQWPEWSTWQRALARAYGQQIQLDVAIGDVLRTLEETGQAEDTIVVWVSDHGDALGSHGGLWDKHVTYTEEVARVLLAVRWPGEISGGGVSAQVVSNIDVTATMLDAAGTTIPKTMHSRSLLSACRAPGEVDPDACTFAQHHGHGDLITERIVVTDRWKYVAAWPGDDELYDLANDPYELTNLADAPEHADVKAALGARIIAHIEATDDAIASRRLLYKLKHRL